MSMSHRRAGGIVGIEIAAMLNMSDVVHVVGMGVLAAVGG
jgi:hypothetical protein